MPSKRLLLVSDDAFLCQFYRAKLESVGFEIREADSIPLTLDALVSQKPDLLIIDPLLRDEDKTDAIELVRAHPEGGTVPILALPTAHFSIARRVESYPHTHQLTSESNVLGELLKCACELLQLPAQDGPSLMVATMPEDYWKQQAIAAAQESLSRMRHGVHLMAREAEPATMLREVLRDIHHFAGQTSLLNRSALSHIARAVEALVFTLERLSDRIDPLTMRTLGQAADFLALLLDHKTYSRVPDLDAAKIIVIEDEASARELIITAMEMVGLHANGEETPNRGLRILGAEPCDLIFLDINLPEMNGFELCNKVRALPLHERTPIVFLTGMNSFQNRVQGNLSGGNDFVGKPFNVAELGVKALIWVMKGRLGLN